MTAFYNVRQYFIEGDGKTNNTRRLAGLIGQIEKDGGGTLFFPAGEYVTGTIELKDNMTLYLDAGAVLLGSQDPDDFPVMDSGRIPGWEKKSRMAIVTAVSRHHVAITGRGKIDGRGQFWWKRATDGTQNDVRPRTIQFISCENVLIEGITIENSPMWTIHPLCCNNVTVTNVTIHNPWDSPNTDGINPESSSNVHISNCHVDVGDDCVTLKSGTQNDSFQRLKACENITITNCTMVNGHGGVVIGSEMSGGVRNVVISNCVFNGTDRGIRIKTRRKRGGTVEDIRINNLLMTDVFCPLVLNGFYECGAKQEDAEALFTKEALPVTDDTPAFRNIYISNVTARNVIACAAFMWGIPESPVRGISIDHFVVDMKEGDCEPQRPAMAYGLDKMEKKGILLSHVQDVSLKDVRLTVKEDSAITIEDASGVVIESIMIHGGRGDKPAFRLKNVQGAYISANAAGDDGAEVTSMEDCKNVKIV